MCQIIGYKNDIVLDETLLGFLATIGPLDEHPFIKFNLGIFLYDVIHK